MASNLPEDWGGSEGAKLPQISEENRQKRWERGMQVVILGLFCAFVLLLRFLDYLLGTAATKDIVIVALPVFTFALGKAEAQ